MAPRPVGTLTFLFSDLEGSTRLLRRLGREVYGQVLADYQRLTQESCQRAGGKMVDSQGDSFFLVFHRAMDAALAATAVQQAFAEHAWPDGNSIRVRIGLHTGEATVEGDRYLGLAVHRAARVCAAAAGGQVLLTQSTAAVLEDEELGELTLRDLGRHELKDFERAVELYQLDSPGLQQEFPALEERLAAAPEKPLPFADEEPVPVPDAAETSRPSRPLRGRALLLAMVAGVIAAAVAIPLFALGQGSSTPGGLGAVPTGNSLAVVDPTSSTALGFIRLGSAPTSIATGQGALWIANSDDRTLSRIDPKTERVVKTIGLQGTPVDVAAGNGAVWLLHSDQGVDVLRVAPSEGYAIDEIAIGFEASGRDSRLALGRGALWIVSGANAFILKLDTHREKIVAGLDDSHGPLDVATGLGAVWVANDGSVWRIDPGSGSMLAMIPAGAPSGAGIARVAVGEGAVWYSNGGGPLWRIDPAQNSATGTIPVGDAQVVGIAVGSGAVWVASLDGAVRKVDPRTNKVVATVHFPRQPVALTAGYGRVWVLLGRNLAAT